MRRHAFGDEILKSNIICLTIETEQIHNQIKTPKRDNGKDLETNIVGL